LDRPNWKIVLPVAAAVGFLIAGFWGLLLGPIAAAAIISLRQKKRADGNGADDEDRRLAAYMAEAAKNELARAAKREAGAVQVSAPASAAGRSAAATASKPSFDELKQRVERADGREAFDALAAARLALIENSRDAHAAAESALLTKRLASRREQADLRLRAAAHAITASLDSGVAPLAAGVFNEFVSERTALSLPPQKWEALGRALLAQGSLMEAAWTMHAGALIAGDRAMAQKRLIEVAGRASESRQPAVALRLYGTLLAKYPDSQFADFVRANMKLEQRKLGKS